MPRIYSRLDDVPNKRYGKFAVIGKPIVFTNPDNNIDIFRNHPSVLKVLDVRSRRVNKNEMDYSSSREYILGIPKHNDAHINDRRLAVIRSISGCG
jgi:hypothetical protein